MLFIIPMAILITSCGMFEPIQQSYEPPPPPDPVVIPPPPAKTCGGRPLGSTRIEQCPAGQSGNILEVCTGDGWNVAQNTCTIECDPDLGNAVNFVGDIQPLLAKACVSCHSVYRGGRIDDYEIAKDSIDAFIYRIQLPNSNRQAMPRPPWQLTPEEKALFGKWKDDGLLESNGCNQRDDTGSEWKQLDLDYLETHILDDLNRIDVTSRENVGYVTLMGKYNRWATEQEMTAYRASINKAVNSLSTERQLFLTDAIDARQTIYRIDLEAFGFTLDGPTDQRDDWDAAIEDGDQFKFESFTNKGLLIKQLSGRDQVWLHADNYNLATHGTPDVYHETLGIPESLFVLLNQEGIDLQDEFDDFRVQVAGFFGSPITQNKNRLISRMESDEGYFWTTFDANSNFQDDKNYFEFPCLIEMNCIKTARHDASEVIYTLPNGLQGYGLYNAAFVREDAAPLDVVQNVNSPFSPEIINGLDCHRCHSQGLIPTTDQVRESVIANASEFDPDDVEKVRAFYPTNSGLSAAFTADINVYRAALNKIGQDIGVPDTVNVLADDLRRDQNARDVAGFLFMSKEQFATCVNGDATLKAQIGQLISSETATISLAQFIVSFPNIVRGCRLGLDPIDR